MLKKIFLSFVIIASFFLLVNSSLAATKVNNPSQDSTVTLSNPIAAGSFQIVIGSVVSQILGVVGALALLMFIYGGLVWMTAAGNDQKITQGKNILMWAAIGLLVIFSSYALVRFVLETIGA
ncbi:MAG: hypothetical protein WC280_03485 [Patescibacteria group bacterium]